jgi:hypothetical protein
MLRMPAIFSRASLVFCLVAAQAACTAVKGGGGDQGVDDTGAETLGAETLGGDALQDGGGDTGGQSDVAGTDATGTDAAGTDAVEDAMADATDAAAGTDAQAQIDAAEVQIDAAEVTADVPPAPGGLTIKVVDAAGLPVAGALVSLPATSTTTGADGLAVFAQVPAGAVVAKISVTGFAPAASKVSVVSGVVTSQLLTINAVATQQTVTATAPVSVQTSNVAVALPANAFVDAAGQAVTANVQVSVSPIDPTAQSLTAAPGPLVGVATGSSQSTPLETAFMADVSFSAGGQPVTLAAGVKADLAFQLPAATAGNYTVGQTLGAWWFDLSTGTWQQDGVGTVGIDANGNKTFTAQVSHFTWWMGALPINDTACLHVNVKNGGQPVSGVQVTAKGISYSAISKGTTGADGSVCLESKAGGSASVFIEDPTLTQIGSAVLVTADMTVLTCSAGGTGCKVVDIAVQAPNACTDATLSCDDQNPCTIDTCDPQTGVCAHTPGNGTPCDDANACSSDDNCMAGACVGKQLTCNDGDPCTVDTCSALTGCAFVATADGSACDDWNACTVGDTCASGKCQSGANSCTCASDSDCNDANVCTLDICVSGKCATTFATSGTACDDHSACTGGDACNSGWCYGGAAIVCDDNNPCTNDACDVSTGCVYANNNSACDDGDVCTSGDICNGGACSGAGSCADASAPDAGAMDAGVGAGDDASSSGNDATGASDAGSQDGGGTAFDGGGPIKDGGAGDDSGSTMPDAGATADAGAGGPCAGLADGTACDDGNPCTTNDTCQGQKCGNGGFNKCDDGNPCTMDNCDPASGKCVYQSMDGMSCEDGNACTKNDSCQGGSCKPGANLCGPCNQDSDCNDNNPCTTELCAANKCMLAFTSAGTACDDGNACTGPDTCSATGNCNGIPLKCDDGNICTMDSCDPMFGCKPAAMADGTACVTGDLCLQSTCQAAACTTIKNLCVGNCGNGTCDPGEDATTCPKDCQPVGKCGDGKCTPGETLQSCGFDCSSITACAQTKCAPVTAACSTDPKCVSAVNCTITCGSDKLCSNACQSGLVGSTANAFSAMASCVGALCGSGSSTCGNGVCEATEDPATCPGDCGASGPCMGLPNGATCTDGNPCTTDICMNGSCMSGPMSCDDGNSCTMDTCMPAVGCTHMVNEGMPCEDGSACTVADTCIAGVCKGGNNTCGPCSADADCNDNNPCTTDKCGATNVCEINLGTGGVPCDDGNACTMADKCDPLGKCYGAPLKCDDGNVCTSDMCDPLKGCTSVAIADGTTCTTGDLCTASSCQAASCTVAQNLCVGTCGNLVCDAGETAQSCPKDCSGGGTSTCGDNKCTPPESPNSCAFDCASTSQCGMSKCAGPWGACGQNVDCVKAVDCTYLCGTDSACKQSCQNAVPSPSKSLVSATLNCLAANCSSTATCGNGICEAGESSASCPPDCKSSICGNGICEAGESSASCPMDCGSSDPCATLPNGATCTDGNACTAESCQNGKCQPMPMSCDDGNACTMDACSPAAGCMHMVNDGMACEDGNGCTQGDTCTASVCTAGSNVCSACVTSEDCNDNNPCTTEVCGGDNVCKITFSTGGLVCSDGNACTQGDLCNGSGQCNGMPLMCDDGNVCTSDMCDPQIGCTAVGIADGTTCTTGDLCSASACEASSCTVVQNLCTGDCGNGICDPAETNQSCPKDCAPAMCGNGVCEAGENSANCPPDCGGGGGSNCTGKPNGTVCSDGNACTQGDTCQIDNCVSGPMMTCDDGMPCTDDTCSPAMGCVNTVIHNGTTCP